MFDLMLRSLLVSGVVTGSAYLFERGLRNAQLPRRHAWTLALLLSAALPFIPQMTTSSPAAAVVSQFSLPPIEINAAQHPRVVDYARVLWLFSSFAMSLFALGAYSSLRRRRKNWDRARIADCDVHVSKGIGPAVFGFIRPQIVVPEWVRTTSHEEQRLILLHEREHIRAGDHLLLLLALLATAWMPWNPFVWVQVRRLRFMMEADCDQRVLAAAPDRARYASLLVDVGSRQAGFLLTAALAEHRNGLEQRIGMIAERLIRNRKKAALLFAGGLVAVVIACESRLPFEETATPQDAKVQEVAMVRTKMPGVPAEPGDTNRMISELRPTMKTQMRVSTTEPAYTPYTDAPQLSNREDVSKALVHEYPASLRDANVGGTSLIWVLIDIDGKVIASKTAKTTGNEVLDAAALKVATSMVFTPALNEETPVPVWIQLPIVFKAQ